MSDRSGLDAEDLALIKVDLLMRDCHFAAEAVATCARKLARLNTLLDSPDLALTHPAGDPDRLDALDRYHEIHHESNRAKSEFRRAAKAIAAAWEDLPTDDLKDGMVAGYGIGWSDSAAWPLALPDPGLGRLRFWQEALGAWKTTPDAATTP